MHHFLTFVINIFTVKGLDHVDYFKAFSSDSRMEIYLLLAKSPMGINELSREVGLRPNTVRHHLDKLIQTGFIEVSNEVKGDIGRPEVYYQATKKNILFSYPKRDYLSFSRIVIDGLKSQLGEDKSGDMLYRIGLDAGIAYTKGLAAEHGVGEWTPEVFKDIFIEGLLKGMGLEPEVVVLEHDKVVFRERNCLFMELAEENISLICDSMDNGFYDGVAKGLNASVEVKRLKCMVHSDPFCEYSFEWRS